MWVLERGAPGRHDASHAIPHDPDFPIALKEQLVIDQSAIHDAGHHFPIADDHANERIFFAALRVFLHHLFRRNRMKMLNEPGPRLAKSRLTSHVIESQHQVDFFIAYLRRHTSFSLLSQVSRLGCSYDGLRLGPFLARQTRQRDTLALKFNLDAAPQLAGDLVLPGRHRAYLNAQRGSISVVGLYPKDARSVH